LISLINFSFLFDSIRRLITQLFVKYFENGQNKQDALNVISKMLGFTDEEKEKVGLIKKSKSWAFLPFIGTDPASAKAPPGPQEVSLYILLLISSSLSLLFGSIF
jgi:hypothetical protein